MKHLLSLLAIGSLLWACSSPTSGSSSTTTLKSTKAITAFSILGTAGTINEGAKTIAVSLPAGTNPAGLVATFTTTGASVKVGSTVQVSGSTANSFSSPVIYVVVAEDGSTASYTVTVSIPVAQCSDGIKDGAETDIDCGGTCAKCGTGRSCNSAADCASGVCTSGQCGP